MQGRIHFEGNPWPEGHALVDFRWTARRHDDRVRFGFHLETARYIDERDPEDEEDDDAGIPERSDWESPGVWGNYGACTLSSHAWHDGGFDACALEAFSPDGVDGLRLRVDPLPRDLRDGFETRAFHVYLLGHDAVADHAIAFSRQPGSDLFDIDWLGRVALAYVGDYDPAYRFHAAVRGVPFPVLDASWRGAD